jgi:hypothetical protein
MLAGKPVQRRSGAELERELDDDRGTLAARTGHGDRSAQRLHAIGEPEDPRAARGVDSAHAVVANRKVTRWRSPLGP